MKPIAIKSDKRILRGMIHVVTDSLNSVILIVHGYFSSNRTGYNRFYYDIASRLANDGYTAVRCDLSGMGESDGNLSEICFDDHVSDVQNVIQYLSRIYQKKVILIGHSIGCLVSLDTYFNIPNFLDKIVLLSPLYFDDTILSRFFDNNMIKELKKTGHTCRNGINVDYSFFNGRMSLSNVAHKIKECKIPLALMVGNSDSFLKKKEIEALHKASDITPVIITNGDHNFSDKLAREKLITEIIFFLDQRI